MGSHYTYRNGFAVQTSGSTSLGAWVAVSEVAGSKGKQSKSSKTSKVMGAFALTLLSVATSSAWAQTCPNGVGVTGGAAVICKPTTSETWVIDGSSYVGTVEIDTTGVGSTGVAGMEIKNSTVTASGAANLGFGYKVSGATGAEIKLSGTNTVNLTSAATDTGILAFAVAGSAGAKIEITDTLNVSAKGTLSLTERDAIEINNSSASTGDSILSFKGNGKVEAAGGNAIFIKTNGNSSSTVVDIENVAGAVELLTTGSGGSGINVIHHTTNTAGSITINSAANINTTGLGSATHGTYGEFNSNGIYARIASTNSTGAITVTNKGAISTLGVKASGIQAETAGTGKVTITNSGKINTTGSKAHGIQSTTNGGGTKATNKDDISTSADGAHGISAIDSGAGAIDIDNNANITTSGLGAHGIYANAKNGDVSIKNSGIIKTASTAQTGLASRGINVGRDLLGAASGAAGKISIVSTGGSIETGKILDSHAIIITSRDATSGDIEVDLTNTDLIVNNSNGDGINIYESESATVTGVNTSNIDVTLRGGSIQLKPSADLVSNPTSNYGIVIQKIAQSTGNITVTNGAEITSQLAPGVTGTGGAGIYTSIAHAGSTGNIVISNDGNITLDPIRAKGISSVNAGSGITSIRNTGTIATKGEESTGIFVNASGTGKITISNAGKIETVGLKASGIQAVASGSADVEIDNTREDITTQGDLAHGLHASTNNGNAVINNEVASIITNGVDASGIRVDQNPVATSGNITITAGFGSYIETNNEQADGIHATIGSEQQGHGTVASTGNIDISVLGSIKTTGASTAEGIYGAIVKPGSTGNVDILFVGDSIETTGTGTNRGIYGRQDGSGDLTIGHEGQLIQTAGAGASGIYALTQAGVAGTVAGNVTIKSLGEIVTAGNEAHGILASSVHDTKGITVTNEGHISVDGALASGIKVASTGAGDVLITHERTATVTSKGNNLVNTGDKRTDAITAGKSGADATGNVRIESAGNITTEGANRAAGIYAYNQGLGDATVIARGNITASATNKAGAAGDLSSLYSYGIGAVVSNNAASTGNATVRYSYDTITTAGDEGYALYAGLYGTKTGVATVYNLESATLKTTGNKAHGIWSRDETLDGGKALAHNTGTVTTGGSQAHGIYANSIKGEVQISTLGSVTTTGEKSVGLSGNINQTAAEFGASRGISIHASGGTITTTGSDSAAIRATSNAASGTLNINMTNGAKIKVQNANSDGIHARNILNDSGNTNEVSAVVININTSGGEIISDPGSNASGSNYGIVTEQRGAAQGDTNITIADTTIKSFAKAGEGKNSAGVMATYEHAAGSGNINVISTGDVLTQGMERGASAYRLTNNGTGAVDFKHGGTATATGKGASGVYIRSATGAIDVLLDANSKIMGGYGVDATEGVNAAGLQLGRVSGTGAQTVTNAGTIGALSDQAVLITSVLGANSTLANTGTITGNFDLAKAAGDVSFNNNAAGVVELRGFADTDGDGVRDTKTVAISNFGTGAATSFTNDTGATLKLAGFTGETTTDTTGEYAPIGALSSSTAGITQAQMLNLKTFANAGLIDLTANGMAGDVLVLSGGSTAGTYGGGRYISNGGTIQFDTVLNAGGALSQSDMLVLDDVVMGTDATKILVNPVVGSVGGYTQGDGIKLIEVLGTQDATAFTLGAPVTYGASEYLLYSDDAAGVANGWYLRNYNIGGGIGGGGFNWFRNPNIGAYLGNQYAASNMFNQNILDRRDNVRAPDQNVWVRANHNEVKTDMLDGLQHAKIKTNLFQVGADVIKHNDFIAGVYAGYGDSQVNNRSNQTGTKADGKVTGYHVGAYGSWMPEENKGPYVDVWGHYGWYKNKLEGAAQRYDSVKYDSTGYSISAEVGYGFELKQDAKGRAWILEPHVQGIYSKLSSDSFLDKNLTYYSDNESNGIQTRVGARFYGQHTQEGKKGVLPFIEANWLHNGMKNGVKLNQESTSSRVGQNVGEVKIGVQGNVSDKFSLFSHVGAQQGSSSFKRYEFQFGLNYNW